MVGREGLRVREHNTRKLIAAVIPPTPPARPHLHFEGGLAVDLLEKGIWFGRVRRSSDLMRFTLFLQEECTSTVD